MALAGSAAVGAALSGLRPVVEIMFMDFITLAMDALVNQAAKARFMFGGQCSVPMVLRTPHGGGLSAGPQHSQCLEAWLAHVPGLKVVCAATPADAYGLLRAAIEDPDPVIFIEHKGLYGSKGPVDVSVRDVIGKASTVRAGRDVTLVTYGATVHTSLAAAQELAGEGVEVEVIDLRSLQPWDRATVLASLARTHRAVIVHEAVQAFGIGAAAVVPANLVGILLFIVGSLALGFLISTVARNQLQAMQMSVFYIFPSLLLSGFMFPFRGMPAWAQTLGSAIPVTHFLRVVRGALLKVLPRRPELQALEADLLRAI